jgi:hypothetical protein
MSKTSRVLFHGLIEEKESFKKRMFALGVPPEMVETILRKAPVILKSGMSAEEARRYAHAVQEARGIKARELARFHSDFWRFHHVPGVRHETAQGRDLRKMWVRLHQKGACGRCPWTLICSLLIEFDAHTV